MNKLEFELSPAIAGKFEVINTTSPILESRIGRVDFRTITLEKAEELVKAGTRCLKAVKGEKGKTNASEEAK